MNTILSLENIHSFYDKSHILFDVNIKLEEGKSVCILGRNGVGKSTMMKTIMGIMNPRNHAKAEGHIYFDGEDILGRPTNRITRKGISYVPQGRHIFPNLTTKENLLIAKNKGIDGNEYWTLEKIYELFPRLLERESSFGGRLSGGEQQMLAVARGLMQNPRVLLLDEITEGLAPIIVQQLVDIVSELIKRGVSILLAEQSFKFALSVSDYCYILERGTVVHQESTDSLSSETIRKYLGT